MKEDSSEFKKTSFIDTLPSTRNTLLTRRITVLQDTAYALTSRKTTAVMQDIDNPQLLSESRYDKVYQEILKDTKKMYKYLNNENETIERTSIKKSISKVLKITEQETDFNDRFLIKPKLRCKTARSTKKNAHIGLTQLQKDSETRKYFFSNHKKNINLQEECMLLQYFLKDEDENRAKTPITYLNTLTETSRHRRMTPNTKDANRLYSTHDQKQYKSLKKRIHLKEEFVQRCGEIAKKNLTYRRKQNFKEIEYILKENNKNMMEENILHQSTATEREQLVRNNQLIRLFLKFQFFLSKNRVYEYFTDNGIDKFKKDLFAINANYALKERDIDEKIKTIIEFKQSKILHYQDFKELVYYISDIIKSDVLPLFLSKYPDYFDHRSDSILRMHQHEIQRYMHNHKIKFLLNVIFNTYPEKLIGKAILPIKLIPSLFKAYGITEKDIDIHHLFYSYHWMQHYDAGLTFQQFYRGSILFGMKGNNWKGIEVLLRKIDIKKYI